MSRAEPRISLLLPTRARPESVRRLVSSALSSASGPVEFVFYVDDDDDSFPDLSSLTDQCHVVRGPRCVLSEMWNRCSTVARADVWMHCGDDIVFRTRGWDDLVLAQFEESVDKLLLVHGRDGYQDAGLATHGFLHRRWAEIVGYFVPPYFASDFNDTWLTEVADALGCRVYLPELYTEHMHPCVGKGVLDRTHQERLARHERDDCQRIYEDTADLRDSDVAKIRPWLGTPHREPVWEILIATLGSRSAQCQRLLESLLPQVERAKGAVWVTALWNNAERPLSTVRQDLLDSACGEYVSFIDDDDQIPPYFVDRVLPLLDGVDYIGWRMQCWIDGRKLLPTLHSVEFTGWYDDDAGFYRDFSHLNPMLRVRAVEARFDADGETSSGEDYSWANQVRARKLDWSEHFIDDVMYFYHFSTANTTTQRPVSRVSGDYSRPDISSLYFRFHPNSSSRHAEVGRSSVSLDWARQVKEWAHPPVDDVGYLASAELLQRSDVELREMIGAMRVSRYSGDRNHANRWRDVMGLDSLTNKDVLDFGCGVGLEASELAGRGNRVSLADITSVNLEVSERVVRLGGESVVASYLISEHPPFLRCGAEPMFDVFYCSGVLHHVPWARAVMERAHELLRSGGEARLMLYSDEGWRLATGCDPPERTHAHPSFMRFVRGFDAVGLYADWYSEAKLCRQFGDLFNVERCEYLTGNRRFLAAVLRRRD